MYIHRDLEQNLYKTTKTFPILLLIGPRQVGKTTLLQHADSARTYVTLDDPLLRALAKEDPALFLQRFKAPLLIDEIQYAPELLPYLKMQVDQSKAPGAYWLTGSQQFHLMRYVTESLAGRVGILKLQGLSQSEKLGRLYSPPFLPNNIELFEKRAQDISLNVQKLYQIIWRGSFPAVVLNSQMNPSLFYSSYVQTYLQRDVRDLSRVGDEQSFMRFLRVSAARTGQLINYADLARDADVAPVTAKAWLSILETSGLVYLLEPYHTNLNKRLVKAAKLYFLDTGLCSYLTGWTSAETLESGAMSGAILETYVISELLKSYWNAGLEAPFYFYRDRDKKEIDLLIIQDGVIYPIEIKKTTFPTEASVKNFSVLYKLPGTMIAEGGVICLAEKLLPIFRTAHEAIPIGCL